MDVPRDNERPEVDVRELEGYVADGRRGVLRDVWDRDVVELPLKDLHGYVLHDYISFSAERDQERGATRGRDRRSTAAY